MNSPPSPPSSTPSCNRCAHYYITYDVNFLHGCRALKFKSRQLPQYDVLAASHADCLAFEPKVLRKSQDGGTK